MKMLENGTVVITKLWYNADDDADDEADADADAGEAGDDDGDDINGISRVVITEDWKCSGCSIKIYFSIALRLCLSLRYR